MQHQERLKKSPEIPCIIRDALEEIYVKPLKQFMKFTQDVACILQLVNDDKVRLGGTLTLISIDR